MIIKLPRNVKLVSGPGEPLLMRRPGWGRPDALDAGALDPDHAFG